MARILVIDDDSAIRHLLRDGLEEAGYEVLEAGNGEEGLNLYQAEPTDLVITDILMPSKEGIGTIHELMRDFPDAKVIAMSGGGMTGRDYLPMAKDLGALYTFKKPFGMRELMEAVAEALLGGPGAPDEEST